MRPQVAGGRTRRSHARGDLDVVLRDDPRNAKIIIGNRNKILLSRAGHLRSPLWCRGIHARHDITNRLCPRYHAPPLPLWGFRLRARPAFGSGGRSAVRP